MFCLLQSAFSYFSGADHGSCVAYTSESGSDHDHPISLALHNLISTGGDAWPPRATFEETWPPCLRPYHHVFQRVAPFIPVEEASLDDEHNRHVIETFRARVRQELVDSVCLEDVKVALLEEEGTSERLSTSAWLGFFACISMLRHAYRWGVTPIVREAQNETSLDFPPELEWPSLALRQRYGHTSPGGCLTSNVLCNLDDEKEVVYSCTAGMSNIHRSAEKVNAWLFREMEDRALPLYRAMGDAARFLDSGDIDSTVEALKIANQSLKTVFQYFYENLVDRKVSQQYWMAYVQGFHAWTLDGIDGAGGGQALVIKSLDAFLDIQPVPEPEVEALHFPSPQRDWLNALRKYNIRQAASHDPEVTKGLEHLVRQLKTWRMGHLRRMRPYEGVERPERKKMTAGKSVLERSRALDSQEALQFLQDHLATRLAETR
ncbi:hypothetical protein SERLA73DRAFT_77957 [Serpula lacrymans var. lacrymans S7.3]|uniref:Indoleamine 2,3-dioxygenase n=2 Tax=Serpula lacrymans var. lacrymans TaxID=341189 RepID=F8QBK9_SERL3|nr:uncharacterized protein SERLADRAFT_442865 [Serpula lacrymans var. lacrymans S7.9]EGN94595.1 hypothetical protein SERLA73DRAFT_77957 [Serpula lacrymans var. lacrymans S7.3]EGO20073.1 hypothetical protein SERLADRAFT_442865 [Serpula lacrymans var. lacrymans S7.9]